MKNTMNITAIENDVAAARALEIEPSKALLDLDDKTPDEIARDKKEYRVQQLALQAAESERQIIERPLITWGMKGIIDKKTVSLPKILADKGIEDSVWALRCFDYADYCLFLAAVVEPWINIFEIGASPRLAVAEIISYKAGDSDQSNLWTAALDARKYFSAHDNYKPLGGIHESDAPPHVAIAHACYAAAGAVDDGDLAFIACKDIVTAGGNWADIETEFRKLL